jgi:hypothetical protein
VVRKVPLGVSRTDEWTERTIGTPVIEAHYERRYLFAGEAVDVYKPNGSLLFALRPGALPWVVLDRAYPALLKAARPTHKRPAAQGGAAELWSATVGYLNGAPTHATKDIVKDGWADVRLLLAEMDRVFARECPEEYAVLRDAAGRKIDRTSFSSAAVNRWSPTRNARFAYHRDDGNIDGGYGAMTVVRAGEYTGGLLVFPQYRAAVGLDTCDVLIADNQEVHGNSPIVGTTYTRLSVVAYFHASNRLS